MKNRIFFIALILGFTNLSSGGQGIQIGTGAQLVAQGNVYIVLENGGITNNGSFLPSTSTLKFTGNSSTSASFLAGSSSISLYNLSLAKSANGIQLNRDIAVSNLVNFVSGDSIFLNNHILDLGSSGALLNESNSSRITGLTGGYVQSTQTLNAPSLAAPGNLGIQISSSANLGSTIIRRGHKQQGGISVFRYYDIIPTNNTGLNAQLIVNYFDAELAGIGEGNLAYFESFNNGIGYTNLGLDNLDISTNKITKNGVDQLARFTLSNISLPLSVTLLELNAKLIGEDVLLKWSTVAEKDFKSFVVERRIDGSDFQPIKTVNGFGNGVSGLVSNYQVIDPSVPTGHLSYRLKMVDIDGRFTYSKTIQVIVNRESSMFLSLYPNPTKDYLKIRFRTAIPGPGYIKIVDAQGKLYYSGNIKFINGFNEYSINVQDLARGFYQLKIVTSENAISSSFIKF